MPVALVCARRIVITLHGMCVLLSFLRLFTKPLTPGNGRDGCAKCEQRGVWLFVYTHHRLVINLL